MRFKLDENLSTSIQALFRDAGHDAETVWQEALQGASDQCLYELCRLEHRCLVTLDLDFSDVVRFSPEKTGGIAVIRVPRNPSLSLLQRLVRQFLRALEQMPFEDNLWIVEIGRIRVHQTNGG